MTAHVRRAVRTTYGPLENALEFQLDALETGMEFQWTRWKPNKIAMDMPLEKSIGIKPPEMAVQRFL
jgi:hypothetical protein